MCLWKCQSLTNEIPMILNSGCVRRWYTWGVLYALIAPSDRTTTKIKINHFELEFWWIRVRTQCSHRRRRMRCNGLTAFCYHSIWARPKYNTFQWWCCSRSRFIKTWRRQLSIVFVYKLKRIACIKIHGIFVTSSFAVIFPVNLTLGLYFAMIW